MNLGTGYDGVAPSALGQRNISKISTIIKKKFSPGSTEAK